SLALGLTALLSGAGLASAGEHGAAVSAAAKGKHKQVCQECAKVVSINVTEKKGESNAVGLIAGGAAGALLGHQVGGGTGRDVATIAGAVGGAYAGKKIQEQANTSKVWNVHVKYDNGQQGSFAFDRDPGLRNGDLVRNEGGALARR
ncbi:MAG: glycine zipper 2TM domain-containing protein, partial [Massilia sp.]